MARPSKLWQHKEKGGWWATINGQRQRFGDTLAIAKPAFEATLKAAQGRKAVKGSVAEWVDVFLDHKQKTTAAKTYGFYQHFCQSFVSFDGIGNLHISKLRLFHVKQWLAAHKEWNQACPITAIKALIHFLQKDIKAIHRDDVDTSLLKPPKYRRRAVCMTEVDHAAILTHATSQAFRDICNFMYETGCRPYEAYRLRNRHVQAAVDANGKAGLVAVYPYEEMPIHKTEGEGKPRVIAFTAKAAEIVNRLRSDDLDAFIFTNAKGQPWKAWSLNNQFEKLKLRLSIYRVGGREMTGADAVKHYKVPLTLLFQRAWPEFEKRTGKAVALIKRIRYCPYAYRHGDITRCKRAGMSDITNARLHGHSDT